MSRTTGPGMICWVKRGSALRLGGGESLVVETVAGH